jgi:small subunit ribosomal protein S19
MSRSAKKGPFMDEKLVKKVEALNTSGQKKIIRPGLGLRHFA